MKSEIKRVGDTIVVSVGGRLDYETQDAFKDNLQRLARAHSGTDSTPTRIIFNMENLEFVGSSGISQFIQTVKEFAVRTDSKARIIHASSDFKKVMRAFDENQNFEFIEREDAVFPAASRANN